MHGSTGAEAEAEAEARGCLGGWVRPRQRQGSCATGRTPWASGSTSMVAARQVPHGAVRPVRVMCVCMAIMGK